jgi:acylglycerol lipase
MEHATGTFTGIQETFLFSQHWLPEGTPRAVVIIVHGYAEHSGRYVHVATPLALHGYAVYTLDHRGHGQSGGRAIDIDRFEDYVDDLKIYFDQVRAQYPTLPLFVYGHSMGCAISLLFALRYQDQLAGLITSGTALKLGGTNPALIVLLKGLKRLAPNVRLVKLDANGISRDPVVVKRYREDPLVYTGKMPVKLAAELQRAAEYIEVHLPELHLPYLAMHGGADPITLPAGADIVRQQCKSSDLTVKIYDGLRHEVHNEPEQQQVIDDVIAWLDAHTQKS